MHKLRNITFCTLSIALLFTAIAYKGADITDTLPSSLDNGKKSYLEGKSLQSAPKVSFSGFVEGTLQDDIEAYLSGCFPARDSVLLLNASMQEEVITCANTIFKYPAYPTFFGSTCAYSEKYDSIVAIPDKLADKEIELTKTAELYNSFAVRNPHYRYFLYMPDKDSISPSNPLYDLQSTCIDWYYLQDNLVEKLDPLFLTYTEPILDTDIYYDTHFRTDHHWNMTGAYEGYLNIANLLGIHDVIPLGEKHATPVDMYGSYSRRGMQIPTEPDNLFDYDFDLPAYSVHYEETDTTGGMPLLAKTWMLSGPETNFIPEKFQDRYAEYFPSRGWLSTIENPGCPDGNALLIIGDSYSRPIDRLLAAHYKTTYTFDPRITNTTLEEFLIDHPVDDILFLGTNELLTSSELIASLR